MSSSRLFPGAFVLSLLLGLVSCSAPQTVGGLPEGGASAKASQHAARPAIGSVGLYTAHLVYYAGSGPTTYTVELAPSGFQMVSGSSGFFGSDYVFGKHAQYLAAIGGSSRTNDVDIDLQGKSKNGEVVGYFNILTTSGGGGILGYGTFTFTSEAAR